MNIDINIMLIFASIASFAVAFLTTPLIIRLAYRFGIVTDHKVRKHPAHTHRGVLPRGGGLPLFLGIFLPLATFITGNKIVLFIFLGALFTTIIGLLDDKYDMSAYLRFVLNIMVAGLAVVGGIGIPFITNPFDSVIRLDKLVVPLSFAGQEFQILVFADIAAVLWIVWCMNMINWSKGVDGQLPGFVFVAALFLGLLSLRFSRHDISKETVTILSFATAFSFLGFLPWNFYPQKILPGYGAGSLAGYMLAVLSILSWGKLGTLMLVIALPFTDAVLVLARRIFSKKSPFKADRGHFHHLLLDMGWGRARIAVFYWLVSFIIGLFALVASSEKKIFALLLLFFVFSAMIVWSFYFVKQLYNRIKEYES